jgi:hypothetical protein
MMLIGAAVAILAAFIAARLVSDEYAATLLDDLHWTIAYGVGAVFGWMGYRRAPARARVPQRWFAWGLTSSAIGQLAWDVQELAGWTPFPAPSDVFFMALGPCCAYGMLSAVRDRLRDGLRWPFILDVTMFVIAMFAITLAIFLPQTPSGGITMGTVGSFAFTMLLAPCFMAVIAPTLKLVPRPSTMLLPMCLVVNGALWMQWIYFVQMGTLLQHTWLFLVFSVVSLLMGWGVYQWRLEISQEPAWERRCEAILRLLPLTAVGVVALSVGLAWWLPDVSSPVRLTIYARVSCCSSATD